MIDTERLTELVELYKENLPLNWPEEKYKWEAVEHFQKNWEPETEDFRAMFEKATEEAANLLASSYFYPRKMILKYCEKEPETVRGMFADLFEGEQTISERIEHFKRQADTLRDRYNEPNEKQHYQNTNAISTYLWLHDPDKYYIYKYSVCTAAARDLKSDYVPKGNGTTEEMINGQALYHGIKAEVQKDEALLTMLKSLLEEERSEIKDDKGLQLNTLVIDIAFFIYYYYPKINKGPAIWKISHGPDCINDDLSGKLDKNHWIIVNKNTNGKGGSKISQGEDFICNMNKGDYFYLCRGNSIRLFGRVTSVDAVPCLLTEDEYYYREYEEIKASKDSSPYRDTQKWWTPNDNSTCIKVKENEKKQFEELILKKYFDLTLQKLDEIKGQPFSSNYGKDEFLREVFMTSEQYDSLAGLLKHKQNVILQGAPGVGKTYCAKRLAYSLMGEKDESRIQFIQFHQNYSYEDFIMGYKPAGDGFELKTGIFYDFCQKAAKDPERDYFFIIDEINRGNLSKIFGELLMLIEKDYRGETATLAYTGEKFSVPKNLYIIGMMNTADRSLALLDYALRRRFSFFEMNPGFDTEGFKRMQEGYASATCDVLIKKVIELNEYICKDDALGAGFQIGHSYFCGAEVCTEEWLKAIVYYDIFPTLQEYWFDDKAQVQKWKNILSGVFNDQ